VNLRTTYGAGKKMSGKRWKDGCSISYRPFFCRFLLTALVLALLAALHGVELKLGDVVSNHNTTLVIQAGVWS
jgi:hypothetical protein